MQPALHGTAEGDKWPCALHKLGDLNKTIVPGCKPCVRSIVLDQTRATPLALCTLTYQQSDQVWVMVCARHLAEGVAEVGTTEESMHVMYIRHV